VGPCDSPSVTPLKLDAERLQATAELLEKRIEERFPDSGLLRVCSHIVELARGAAKEARFIARAHIGLRTTAFLFLLCILAAIAFAAVNIRLDETPITFLVAVQTIESLINEVFFLGLTVIFLFGWETRVKRRRVLRALHRLRSVAHVIDMHQLTKDPERLSPRWNGTESSPGRTMSAFQLQRYLDYSSEMLSICGKIAALYVSDFPDDNSVAAVNDLEDLTTGLSRKIWQKIMILDFQGAPTKDSESDTDSKEPSRFDSGNPPAAAATDAPA